MRNRLASILTTWPFVGALIILMVNDWWLKYEYPSVITGKLSDFAGIAVVALLSIAAYPNRVRAIYFAISVMFLWWKSPASAILIQFVNEWAPIHIGRTVDYTDLVALCALPACQYVVAWHMKYRLPWIRVRKFLMAPVIAATLFGIMGTSMITTRQEYAIRSTDSSTGLRREAIAETIGTVAAAHGLLCLDCAVGSERSRFSGNGITMTYSFQAKNAVAFDIEAYSNGIFFGATGQEKADALRASLKRALAERFKELEYIEQLRAPQGRRP